MDNFIKKGKQIFLIEQTSVLSAASVISAMIVLAQIFGIIRRWVVLKYFGQETYALYLAAFRLPDLLFEVLTFGALSAAFIPVFTRHLKKDKKEALEMAGRIVNIGLLIFVFIGVVFATFSYQFYSVIVPGFSESEVVLISRLARVIFIAQGFFVVSYVLTGVLESMRRFLVPALAPLFYYLGIILATVFLSPALGIYAPAIGAVFGALLHLIIQLVAARHFGFRFSNNIRANEGVKEVGTLAVPRFIELGTLQIQKSAELLFSSLISKVSYGFLDLASSLQSFPTVLFAVPLAKVALVSLSRKDDDESFKSTFLATLYQIMFFVIPLATLLVVLRVPIVRLVYGTSQSLDWDGTVQTSLILSAFAVGIPLQAGIALLTRAFYARRDTKMPVMLAILDVVLTVIFEIIFVLVWKLPVWSIALANTLAAFVQATALFYFLGKKLNNGSIFSVSPIIKSIVASLVSGGVMFVLLKLFDRSVWVKRLSFLSEVGDGRFITFQSFVLDTRYTFNLLILTVVVAGLGIAVYILLSFIFGSRELTAVLTTLRIRKLFLPKEKEPVNIDTV